MEPATAAKKRPSPLKGRKRKEPSYWKRKDAVRESRLERLGLLKDGHPRIDKIELGDHEIAQIQGLAGLRLSLDEIASIMGFSRETLRKRRQEDPRIDLAMERGKSLTKQNVTATAYRMATSGKSPRMTSFWLERADGWRQRIDLGLKRPTEDLTEEEILERLKELRADNGGRPY